MVIEKKTIKPKEKAIKKITRKIDSVSRLLLDIEKTETNEKRIGLITRAIKEFEQSEKLYENINQLRKLKKIIIKYSLRNNINKLNFVQFMLAIGRIEYAGDYIPDAKETLEKITIAISKTIDLTNQQEREYIVKGILELSIKLERLETTIIYFKKLLDLNKNTFYNINTFIELFNKSILKSKFAKVELLKLYNFISDFAQIVNLPFKEIYLLQITYFLAEYDLQTAEKLIDKCRAVADWNYNSGNSRAFAIIATHVAQTKLYMLFNKYIKLNVDKQTAYIKAIRSDLTKSRMALRSIEADDSTRSINKIIDKLYLSLNNLLEQN